MLEVDTFLLTLKTLNNKEYAEKIIIYLSKEYIQKLASSTRFMEHLLYFMQGSFLYSINLDFEKIEGVPTKNVREDEVLRKILYETLTTRVRLRIMRVGHRAQFKTQLRTQQLFNDPIWNSDRMSLDIVLELASCALAPKYSI